MTFLEAKQMFEVNIRQLDDIWNECWQQAKNELRGNWQDPDVMKRWRERAYELADERLQTTKISVHWDSK